MLNGVARPPIPLFAENCSWCVNSVPSSSARDSALKGELKVALTILEKLQKTVGAHSGRRASIH